MSTKFTATDLANMPHFKIANYTSPVGEIRAIVLTSETLRALSKAAAAAESRGGWVSASAQDSESGEITAILLAPHFGEVPGAVLSEIAKRYLPENLPQ